MTINFIHKKNTPQNLHERLEQFADDLNTEKKVGNRDEKYAPGAIPRVNEKPIGEQLIEMGSMSRDKLNAALEFQKRKGGLLGEAMLKMGAISKDQLQTALGIKHGMLRPDTRPEQIPYGLVVAKQPLSALSEEFRGIRTRLMTTLNAQELNLFSVSSAEARLDADYLTANLAASFAQLGKKTLILDADLRTNRMARFFLLKPDVFLKNVLAGEVLLEDMILPTVVTNLYVACSGGPTNISQELLAGNAFSLLLDEAADEFDVVIVISAPFGKVTDGQLVWTQTKRTFVSVRKDQDKASTLKKMNTILRQVGADVIGVSLTK